MPAGKLVPTDYRRIENDKVDLQRLLQAGMARAYVLIFGILCRSAGVSLS